MTKRSEWSTNVKTLILSCGIVVLGAAAAGGYAGTAYAHGYMEGPTSRALLCKQGENKNCGSIQYEPQSVEAKGNFPVGGPKDGEITGGGIFPELFEQSADRWTKVTLHGGKNTMSWHLTAPHSTKEWKYYITKKGWNPNEPLKRSDLELFASFQDGGKKPQTKVSHEVTIPTDRSGYHIILGVWEIADTGNAFYQVVDVNLVNNGEVQPPTVPSNLESKIQTAASIELGWAASNASNGIKQYEIYRDGKLVGTSVTPSYVDKGLTASTSYVYTVVAVDGANNRSAASSPLTVTTKAAVVDTEAPSVPTNVRAPHTMTTGVHLVWDASKDNVGVAQYEVFRNGTFVGTAVEPSFMDQGLKSGTTYTYTVVAVDEAGNRSAASNAVQVTTKSDEQTSTTWDSTKVYVSGDRVTYQGLDYEAKWWTQGDKPGSSDVWKLLSDVAQEWNSSTAYDGQAKVTYEGATYQAKWWTKGETPGKTDVWKLVK
ncbi:chitin-binding protein [Paenibacillus sp. cl6col]|uniref:lytic polysaccharide monooxygenase n=1 Tax=Paenibacillus sp. cl6col TaxID=1761878 RepID=UPI00087E7CE3|nr:lytic polysaccharide monooxygenase [Paenibacillus sp. cl6col]SDG17890.1 chitin-binding protein [Paenibacillus sp. cl6col]